MESKGVAKPIVFGLAVFIWSNTCIDNSNFRPHLENEVQIWSKLSKISKSARNGMKIKSVGQFSGENEIYNFSLLVRYSD